MEILLSAEALAAGTLDDGNKSGGCPHTAILEDALIMEPAGLGR